MCLRAFAQATSIICLVALCAGLASLERFSSTVPYAHAASPSAGGCPLFPANTIWNTDISSLMVSANSGQARQPTLNTPTPTAQPSATVSPTASATATAPVVTQTAAAGKSEGSGSAPGFFSANTRITLILILGSVGVLLMIILGILRRLQEVKRLAAEAQQKKDSQSP